MANERLSKQYTPKSADLPAAPLIDLIVTNRANPDYETKAVFLIDSGADFTIIGYDLIKTLHLEGKGGISREGAGIGSGAKTRKTTKVYIKIPELKFKKSINAIMIEPENEEQANDKKTLTFLSYNYLGRDFLNQINVFLLGENLRYILHVGK